MHLPTLSKATLCYLLGAMTKDRSIASFRRRKIKSKAARFRHMGFGEPEGKPSVARILIGLPFPISRGKIQFFCVEILCGKWEMRSEHSTSSFLISYFSFLTSHISFPASRFPLFLSIVI